MNNSPVGQVGSLRGIGNPAPQSKPYLPACTALAGALLFSLSAYAASPVADAAMQGDKSVVKSLIASKADVNAAQPDGATALQWAAYKSDLDLLDLLIKAGANVKAANHDGATAMSLAAERGNAVMIDHLLAAGVDVNEKGPHGETPLMMASRNGTVDAIKTLIAHKADVNAKETLRGTTALMWAAEQSHPAAAKLLLASGADFSVASAPEVRPRGAYLAPSAAARFANGDQLGGGNRNRNGRGGAGAQANAAAGGRGGRGGAPQTAGAPERTVTTGDDVADAAAFFGNRNQVKDGGGMTALVFAAREGDLETVKILVEAGANVNQVTNYGWSALLTATQNKNYQIGKYLLDHGADPNIANNGGWRPLYLATDNRNIEGGDYPIRPADMDHLEFIKLLIDKGADVNGRNCGKKSTATVCAGDSTETRTIFTNQWLYEDGATAFVRAAQSGDVTLMKLLLAHGADPKIATAHNVTALATASGIGWVEGITFQWSEKEDLEAVKMCLDLGVDVNAVDSDGRSALHGAAHKGSVPVIQALVDHGAKMDVRDFGSRDTTNPNQKKYGYKWLPVEYADGVVRVGVQSSIAHPEAAALLRKLMKEHGLEVPPTATGSVCIVDVCKGE
ncbi:MAG TPA: ankyrin repeat domain-containing protein [Bryobacteraceae bacterium]|nr:ankyrin repeat domain-containing protein [Bryobacteraceae bacterium]